MNSKKIVYDAQMYILYIMCERAHVFNNCLQKPSGSIECGNITLQF